MKVSTSHQDTWPLLTPVIEGHVSRDCPKPRDWSRVTCQNCGKTGHTKVRCKEPPKEGEESFAAGEGFGGESGAAGDDTNATEKANDKANDDFGANDTSNVKETSGGDGW